MLLIGKQREGWASTNLPGYWTTKDCPFKAKVIIFYYTFFQLEWYVQHDIVNLNFTTNPVS